MKIEDHNRTKTFFFFNLQNREKSLRVCETNASLEKMSFTGLTNLLRRKNNKESDVGMGKVKAIDEH